MFKSLIVITLLIGIVNGRDINSAGLALIKKWEGFVANFYNDSVGIKTIGYGHACHVNNCSLITPPLTEAQASQLLLDDLVTYQDCVQNQVSFVNDNQFAALVSFTFNLGCAAFEGSTLLKYLKAKNYTDAADQFGLWVHAGGKVLQGLVNRRAAEKALFLTPVSFLTKLYQMLLVHIY